MGSPLNQLDSDARTQICQSPRDMRPRVGAETEFQRFTLDDVNAGQVEGWTFASGWYAYQTSWWAWFTRPMHGEEDGEVAQENP